MVEKYPFFRGVLNGIPPGTPGFLQFLMVRVLGGKHAKTLTIGPDCPGLGPGTRFRGRFRVGFRVDSGAQTGVQNGPIGVRKRFQKPLVLATPVRPTDPG